MREREGERKRERERERDGESKRGWHTCLIVKSDGEGVT